MHILIDARMVGEKPSGIARYVSSLVKALAATDQENNYTVLVANNILEEQVKAVNFKFHSTKIRWLSFEEQFLLPWLVKKLKADVFHATSFVLPLFSSCKTVVTIHDLIHVIFPGHYGLIQKLYYRFVIRKTLRQVSKVIAVSESTKNDLIRYFSLPANSIKVIYEAVDNSFKPINDQQRLARFKANKLLPQKFVLYVGNRKKHKNLACLFAAFAQFKQLSQTDHKLVISGEKEPMIEKLAGDFNIERYLIYCPIEDHELPLLYNAADLFVFPSLYEGFGFPPLEAMACGTPVITSNVSSLPEVVGNAALLVAPQDITELAKKMGQVITDQTMANNLKQKGLERVLGFSWEKCALESLSVYKEASQSNFDLAKIENILIIKLAAIGDLLMITPAVRAIRRNFPQAKISLLVGKWSKPIIFDNPNLNEVIEIADEAFFKIKPLALLSLIFKLRRKKYDLVFVWHRSLAFRVFAWLLGIKTRVGFSRQGNASFLTNSVEENPKIHEIYEYQSTLKPLGIESSEMEMDLSLGDHDKQVAETLWSKFNLSSNDYVIGIAPGGAKNPKEYMPLRHWPAEYYAQLADLLIEQKQAKILLLGASSDLAIANKIISLMRNKSAINLCGQTNLKELAAVTKKCRLFLGNDSAPMHIAAAVKTQAITFFGPTDPEERAPLNYKHKYFYGKTACAPCYRDGSFPDCKTKECLYKIKPQAVWEYLLNHVF